MQTVLQKRAYLKEYQAKNQAKIRIIRWRSKRKLLGLPTDISYYQPKAEAKKGRSTNIIHFREYTEKDTLIKTPHDLCYNCSRRYLVPLGCLFCK